MNEVKNMKPSAKKKRKEEKHTLTPTQLPLCSHLRLRASYTSADDTG